MNTKKLLDMKSKTDKAISVLEIMSQDNLATSLQKLGAEKARQQVQSLIYDLNDALKRRIK